LATNNNNIQLQWNAAAKSFPYAETNICFAWQVVLYNPGRVLTGYTHTTNTAFTDDKFACLLMAMFIDEHGARELSEAITSAEKRPV